MFTVGQKVKLLVDFAGEASSEEFGVITELPTDDYEYYVVKVPSFGLDNGDRECTAEDIVAID